MTGPKKWLIIELSEHGEYATYPEITNSIVSLFGDGVEYFIPIHQEKMGSYTSTSVLFDGYVFVCDCPLVRSRLTELSDYRVFSKVLETCGRAHTINSHTIGAMKRKLKKSAQKNLTVGTKVKVLDGIFSNLIGEIVGVDDGGKKVIVKIKTLSREMVAPLPSTCVEVCNESSDS